GALCDDMSAGYVIIAAIRASRSGSVNIRSDERETTPLSDTVTEKQGRRHPPFMRAALRRSHLSHLILFEIPQQVVRRLAHGLAGCQSDGLPEPIPSGSLVALDCSTATRTEIEIGSGRILAGAPGGFP